MKKPRPVTSDQTFEAVGVATAAIKIAVNTSKPAARFFMQPSRLCESGARAARTRFAG
jgi:hypothetical protein